ncbi:MAG: type II secretion system GspH family protein [Verrucomicrobiales bacterium]|jgi:prepilin-type N-terminal cleavage/methylation domain-containing protein|nr:type II secretion system GspH family protein [Verrucomicrobiales bacterium]
MHKAFTLTELLVTVTIVAILGALSVGGVTKVLATARKTAEISAGRTLAIAYLDHATDHDGQYLPGMDFRVTSLPDLPGAMAHTCQRYPFRLAPYFNNNLAVLLAGQNRAAIRAINNGSETGAMYDYLVSCFPSFGMNIHLIGGQVDALGRPTYPRDCLTTAAAGGRLNLILFATAASTDGTTRVEGFNQIIPPAVAGWRAPARRTDAVNPGDVGNLDARYHGKALVIFLNGSVQELTLRELQDMRLWCQAAADLDDPNYLPQ